MNKDAINPDHYKAGGIEVIDILKAKLTPEEFRGFLMGNVIKYTLRAGMKNGEEDMKKAAWYSSMLAGVDPRKKDERNPATFRIDVPAAKDGGPNRDIKITTINPMIGAEIRYVNENGIPMYTERYDGKTWMLV